jgi:antirestriction protein ArdC
VFNSERIEGLAPEYYGTPAEAARDLGTEADSALDAFFAATGAQIRTSDEPQAYYDPTADHIHMPPIATFHAAKRKSMHLKPRVQHAFAVPLAVLMCPRSAPATHANRSDTHAHKKWSCRISSGKKGSDTWLRRYVERSTIPTKANGAVNSCRNVIGRI